MDALFTLITAIVFITCKLVQFSNVAFWCEYSVTVIIPIVSLIIKNSKDVGFYGLYCFACYLMLLISIIDVLENIVKKIKNALKNILESL